MASHNATIARAAYNAYVNKDRAAIEALIAHDLRFTSPLDNGLNRESYFAICWPNSANTDRYEIVHIIEHGEQVFVTYKGRRKKTRSRKTEILTV